MDKLFHIEWGDDDNSFVLAQDDVEAREKMGDIRDMIRTVCELPSVFQEIFELGKGAERERIEKEFIWGQVPYLAEDGTIKEWTMRCISDKDWQALREGETDG